MFGGDRTALLSASLDNSDIDDVLNAISAELTTDDLIALRDRVEGDEKASASTAAQEWLSDKGLI